MEHAISDWVRKSPAFQEPTTSGGLSRQEDYTSLLEPHYLTGLLHESVPAAARANLEFLSVKEGSVEMRLPLVEGATNQHGTHQATVIALAGDYTGGCAIASLLRGVPIIGIHPVYGSDAMCLWLAGFEIEYYSPSCTDLIVIAEVPGKKWSVIRKQFWQGRSTFMPVAVCFNDSQGNLVAKARMTYYLKHSAYLCPREERQAPAGFKRISYPATKAAYHLTKGKPVFATIRQCLTEILHPRKPREVSIVFEHMLKSSARLIANLRGRQCQNLADKASAEAGGAHGELLANHFISVLPEIQEMVHSRTLHGDELIKCCYDKGVRQVVMVGAGLDFRPWKMPEDIYWFELDLPEMIQERSRVIESLQLPQRNRFPVVANFLRDSLRGVLKANPDFDALQPAVILFEGIAMYFEPEDARKLLSDAAGILSLHAESRLWIDLPTEAAINGTNGEKEVTRFLEAMAKLGEPFLFGCDDPKKLLEEHSMDIISSTDSGSGNIFKLYKFIVAKRGAAIL
jgi:methyltransferase (TIGR00027 family)